MAPSDRLEGGSVTAGSTVPVAGLRLTASRDSAGGPFAFGEDLTPLLREVPERIELMACASPTIF